MTLKDLVCRLVMIVLLFARLATFEMSNLSAEEPSGTWVSMFPNESFDGWKRTNTPPETWSFEDGLLVCSGKPIGELRTTEMYQNFIMELEWRHMVPGGNAGIFVWADDITAKGVPFHRGIEVQVLENDYGNTQSYTTHGDIFPIHGATMVPVNGRGGSRAFPTESRSKPSPQWNHYRIVCRDGEISLAVNGKEVTRGKECWPRRGYICLESEGGVVHYRNVRIQKLPDTKISVSDIAIIDRGYESIYSGLDLRGWVADSIGKWKSSDWVLSYQGPKARYGSLVFDANQLGDALLFDFRLKADSSGVQLAGVLRQPLDLREAMFSKTLSPQGQWNRFELTRTPSGITVTLNGNEIDFPTDSPPQWADAKSKLVLQATGDVDFANLYRRTGR